MFLEHTPLSKVPNIEPPLASLIMFLKAQKFLQGSMTVILIVEDEVLASEYLEFVLQEAGYEAITAASADEAIEVLEHRNDIRLAITDINLPGLMNGLKLAATVKDRWPPINTIIVSGYSAPGSGEMPSGSLFVPKPYNAGKMIAAVRHFQ
jgi:CheY-like chemotaxis protein